MKKAVSVFSTVLMVVMLLAVAAFSVPKLFGVKLFSIITPSMTPAYPVGTLIYVVPTDFEDLQVGDVVSCVINEKNEVLTHRIAEIDSENQTVITHGDANAPGVNDSPALYGNVLGVVRFSVPKLGFLATFLSHPLGKITAIGAIVVVVLFSVLTGGSKKEKGNADAPSSSDAQKNTGKKEAAAKSSSGESATVS